MSGMGGGMGYGGFFGPGSFIGPGAINNFDMQLRNAYNEGVNTGYEQAAKQALDSSMKKNIIFRTGTGLTKSVIVNYGTTVGDAIKLYLKIVGLGHLINTNINEKILFLFNAAGLDINSTEKVEVFFRDVVPTVVVSDLDNLIGA